MKTNLMRLAVALLLLVSTSAVAQERILSFSSDITVSKDATMVVRETIKVECENIDIKHGIYRDFPTIYTDKLGNRVVVGFGILSVTRDGASEPYHTKGMPNGVRIYIGSPDALVSQGEHTYVLTYQASRELSFFADHDELYWNVTGNGWVFPIDKAEATVTLPSGIAASDVRLDGWTGEQGSTAHDLKSCIDSSGRPSFRTTAQLGSYQGLTIAVAWPKGFVTPPNNAQLVFYFLHDNRGILVAVLGLFITLAYFIWAQMKVGIDPSRGAIVPQWDPPDGLSPAAIRYIRQMGSDTRGISAALISAAVKGAIRLDEDKKVYTVCRVGEPKTPLTPEEDAAVENLLHGNEFIVLNQTYNHTIRAAIEAFNKSLDKQFEDGYFCTHLGYAGFGTFLAALSVVGGLLLDSNAAIPVIAIGVVLLVINIIFYRLLRSYTKKGRALMDKAEGLRLYMKVAEQERLNVLDPPDRTPELFEKLLPYALALGVEHQWSEQFSDVLAKAQADGYQPGWYSGRGFYAGNYAGFASSVGNSFSSAISSASTPPGSGGGGFGGGGSSGGGGGGGGGGGW